MAKRYDTPEDFQKDVLKDQAAHLRQGASNQALSGFSWMIMSAIPEWIRAAKPEGRGWLSAVSMGMNIIGIAKVVQSWFTGSKAHTLELERERMGPEQIILPSEMGGMSNMGGHESCNECKLKKHTNHIHPHSLIDQATREQGPIARV